MMVMSLGPDDKRFLDLVAENFAVRTNEEFIEFVAKLGGIVVVNTVLKAFKAVLEKSKDFFENEKIEDSVKELFGAWSEFMRQIAKSSMPEIQIFALYLWNLLHISFLVKMDISNSQFQSYSMNLIERAEDNCAIAQKVERPESEVYFLKLIAEKYLDLFQYGQKNRDYLEKAVNYTKQAVALQENLVGYSELIQSYSFLSFAINELAQFYVETDPVKYQELFEMSYQYIMKGVELARQKEPVLLPKIIIDASANISHLGRLQRNADQGRKYIEEAMALAKEGIAKLNPKDKDYNTTAEGLYNNLGISYSNLGDLMDNLPEKMKMQQASLENKFKALEFAKKTGIKHIIIRDFSNISVCYNIMAMLERATLEKTIDFLQKAIQYAEEAQKLSEKIEIEDASTERHLLQNGEQLSALYEKMLLLEKEHEKRMEWLTKKLNQDRKNIQLAKQWKINPIRIAENIHEAVRSIQEAANKIDSVMIVRELHQEGIDLLLEACNILEEAHAEDERLVMCYRKICNISQELSRIQPNLEKKYEVLIFGKKFGEMALQLAEKLNTADLLIPIADNYGLLVHDIGHALEITDKAKAWDFFIESISIFQKGLSIAKEIPDSYASQAVLLDYMGGSYRDLANLLEEIQKKKEFLMKSAEVKEESLKLFEEYQKAPFDTAVTADSLAITLHQLGLIEEDANKAIEFFSKAIKVNERASELYTQTRAFSKVSRCRLGNMIELIPKMYLTSIILEQDTQKRWEFIGKARASLEQGFNESEVSPIFRSTAEYLLWEYPQLIDQGIDVGGFKLLWDAKQAEFSIFNKSYERSVQFKVNLLVNSEAIPVSEVKFDLEIDWDEARVPIANVLIQFIFSNEKSICLKVNRPQRAQMLERKNFQLINPHSEPLSLQISTRNDMIIGSEKHTTVVGERNIFIIEKGPVEVQDKSAVIELLPEANLNVLYQINIIPRFSGILCIARPEIEDWKYNLAACLMEGPLSYRDAPHLIETDYSPIIFMNKDGNLPSKFFRMDGTLVSGSLADLSERYPRLIRKIMIFGEIFKEKRPQERMELLNALKRQITNIATVNDPLAGITIITNDPAYFDEMQPLIEKEKAMLAQYTDFIKLYQVAKLLEIVYLPAERILPEAALLASNIRSISFEHILICDDPTMAFLSVPWCRFIDSFILTSAECSTEIGKSIFDKAKTVIIIGKLVNKIPELASKKVEYLGKDLSTLTYELHDRLKQHVEANWDSFLKSEYRALFPQLKKEAFGESLVITSKEINDLSYLILAANYAAAKLSSILLIERDQKRLKIETELLKQLDLLTYGPQKEGKETDGNTQKRQLLDRLFAFSTSLRKKYFDERYIQLLDGSKFISIISNIPLPLELMQYGEPQSFLSLEKAVGRLCSTSIEETSILIQYSVLQAMMQSSSVKKATIICPEYFGTYNLPYAGEEADREAKLLGQKRNLGKGNVDTLIKVKLTRKQFLDQLQKNPWLFIHYVGHGDLVNGESCFMIQPSEYVDLVPIKAQDLPPYIPGQPVFIANACLSGRFSESTSGLSGLVFEIIRRGAINFLGTLWEVDDLISSKFISELFISLLDGDFIGDAVQKSRKMVLDETDPTYGAFILFGDPMARIR